MITKITHSMPVDEHPTRYNHVYTYCKIWVHMDYIDVLNPTCSKCKEGMEEEKRFYDSNEV